MQTEYGYILPYGAPQIPPVSMQAFTYNTEPLNIARGGQATASVQIDADADFWVYSFVVGYSSITVDTDIVRPYEMYKPAQLPLLVNIKDTGDGKDINKNEVYVGSIAGDATEPYILQIPRRVRATAVLQIQFRNVSADIDVTGLQFTLGGNKIYYPSDAFGTRGN